MQKLAFKTTRRVGWRLMRFFGMKKASWDFQHRSGMWDTERKSPTLIQKVEQLCNGGTIMEFGCGDGKLVANLRPETFVSYTGSDVSDVAVQACRNEFGRANVRFFQADMAHWTAGGDTVDLIVCEEAIYYLSLNEITRFLGECFCSLTSDGRILVVLHSKDKHADVIRHIKSLATVEEENIVGIRVYLTLSNT